MKRLILICTLSLFYLAACNNNGQHSHNGDTHTHENGDHSHEQDGDHAHDHEHPHVGDHDHAHEQEEFTVKADSLKQDSLEKR